MQKVKIFPSLQKIFEGIDNVRRPKVFNRLYVLDRVLANEPVDLVNDLRNLTSECTAAHSTEGSLL